MIIKSLLFFLLLFVSNALASECNIKSTHCDFTLNHVKSDYSATNLINPCQKLTNISMNVSINYNPNVHKGEAKMIYLYDSQKNLVLYPMGLHELYGFVSDTLPIPMTINGVHVSITRVFLNVYKTGGAMGAVMFELPNGDTCTIQNNPN